MNVRRLILLSLVDNFTYFKANYKSYEEIYAFINSHPQSSIRAEINSLFYAGDIEKILKNGKVYLSLTQKGFSTFSEAFLLPLLGFRTSWNKKWKIVIFNIPESKREERERLRKLLKRSRFARISNSVYISPFGKTPNDLVLSDNVFAFETNSLDEKRITNLAFGLAKLSEKYRDWIKRARRKKAELDMLIGYYDGILKADPALPRELLPNDWPFIVSWNIFIGLVEKKKQQSIK